MQLTAYIRNIGEILNQNRKYVITSFQKEYCWGEEELKVLWEDIVRSLTYKDDEFIETIYYIGTLLLAGDDATDIKIEVLDGQHRLMSITMIFLVMTEIFIKMNEANLVDDTYKYIAGKYAGEPFLKLVHDPPKPFLQLRIQAINKDTSLKPNTEEENRLLFTYEYFEKRLDEESLKSDIKRIFNVQKFEYINLLKVIRKQILCLQTNCMYLK